MWKRLHLVVLAAMALAPPIPAQDAPQTVEVHGFGTWGYGSTDGNNFLFGRKNGDYRYMVFAVNLTASVSEHLTIDAQLDWEQKGDERESEIDFAFAEWRFSDALKLRVGQVKHPFGIYTETFHVGTLRPFLSLPQSIYASVGIVGEAYKGLGITGARDAPGGWRLAYDVYAGGLDLKDDDAPLEFLREGPPPAGAEPHGQHLEGSRNLLGARLTAEAPLDGLSFGVSSYTATRILPENPRITTAGLHGEYLSEAWSVRSEYVHSTEAGLHTLDGVYAELEYHFTKRWQGALRYDELNTILPGVDVSSGPSLLDHREWSIGLNHWFAPNFVVKLSYHAVTGNRLAAPALADLDDAVQSGQLAKRTNVVFFGGELSF